MGRRGVPEEPAKRWLEEETERLRQMRLIGMTRRQIAQRLGRSFQSVQGKLRRTKLPNPKYEEVKLWTKEETEILRRDWESAKSADQISKKLGRTKRAVRGKAWRLGIGPHPTFRHRKFKFLE